MDTVKKILEINGIQNPRNMEPGDNITVEVPGMMDLEIEKTGENRISVAHYYTQRGDLMSDPEIVFKIADGGEWVPIRYTQHPNIHQHDELGLPTVKQFSKQWDRNLKTQRYVEAARENGGEK